MTLKNKLYAVLGVSVISVSVVATAQAEINFNGDISGNLAATSTYMWRGTPQTVDAALQAGVDYADPSGIHLNAWTSNVAFGSEIDLIVGYAGKASGLEYDAGLVVYLYPQGGSGANFEELYIGISQGALSGKFSTSSDMGEYIEIAADFPIKTWAMTAHFGHYSLDVAPDYADYSVTFTKPIKQGYDLGLMISDTDLNGDRYRTTITLSTNFKP